MQVMQPGRASGYRVPALAGVLLATAGLAMAAFGGGCSSSIQTPLPDTIRPPASSSLSDKERKEAVDELNKKRATHEQDAEEQIEQSR